MNCRYILLIGGILSFANIFAKGNGNEISNEVESVGCPLWLGIVISVVCVILVSAVILLFLKVCGMEEKVRKHSKVIKDLQNNIEYDKRISDEAFKSLKDQYDLMMKLIKSTTTSNTVKNTESKSFDDTRCSSQSNNSSVSSEGTHHASYNDFEKNVLPKESKEVFFGSPQNGVFVGGMGVFKPGAIYCIKEDGSAEASFTIADRKEALTVIRRSLSKFLEPACDVIGNTNGEFRNIIVKSPGLVRKTYEGWRIIKKAYVELV